MFLSLKVRRLLLSTVCYLLLSSMLMSCRLLLASKCLFLLFFWFKVILNICVTLSVSSNFSVFHSFSSNFLFVFHSDFLYRLQFFLNKGFFYSQNVVSGDLFPTSILTGNYASINLFPTPFYISSNVFVRQRSQFSCSVI